MSLGSNTVTDTWMASNTLRTPSGPSKKSSAGQPLVARELVRQGQVNLAGELGVPPRLNLVQVVPEPLPIGDPGRGTLRQHDFGVHDTLTAAEVMLGAGLLIVQPFPGAVPLLPWNSWSPCDHIIIPPRSAR
ncbi:hypothetical protein PQI07_37515 [Methylobacterium sp. 092160098-2]|uniref:hypothetical protein n=1 Tax=Methylobacterium sp. 092160098-2 TaxID=3025129 RepID=UPI002381B114|nr:hypothetical protein [Methylobacterium sp. 092160098-2]MDE4916262.1 hypothetical protein [Methylobacterium sp. 092160098-2]